MYRQSCRPYFWRTNFRLRFDLGQFSRVQIPDLSSVPLHFKTRPHVQSINLARYETHLGLDLFALFHQGWNADVDWVADRAELVCCWIYKHSAYPGKVVLVLHEHVEQVRSILLTVGKLRHSDVFLFCPFQKTPVVVVFGEYSPRTLRACGNTGGKSRRCGK